MSGIRGRLGIVRRSLRQHALSTAVTALSLALASGLVMAVFQIEHQARLAFTGGASGFDAILGARGSPLQLVLNTVYHLESSPGNVPWSMYEELRDDPRVELAVPYVLGDSYRGFRIVGTTPDYAGLYAARLQQGEYWQAPLQAVVGAAVARETGLGLGDSFSGAHGLAGGAAHADHAPYRVVGLLAPSGTVLDRLILTSLESVWALHGAPAAALPGAAREDHHDHDHDHDEGRDHTHGGHPDSAAPGPRRQEQQDPAEREITALLLRYATPMAAISLPREVNAQSQLQAAAPAFELARLLQLVGLGLEGLRAFAAVLILSAGFAVFVALYGALEARQYDFALLRCLGATRGQLLRSLCLEGLLLTALGALLGTLLGYAAMAALGQWLAHSRGLLLDPWVWPPQQSWLLLGLLAVGLLASALPAWRAYRSDVARILAQE